MKILLSLLVLSLFVISCEKKQEIDKRPYKPTIVKNIVRVMMHEWNDFTFLVQHPDSRKIGQLKVTTRVVTILTDKNSEELVSVEYECWRRSCKEIPKNFSVWFINSAKLTVHLHSVKEINGAGWNSGVKPPQSGQTTILE